MYSSPNRIKNSKSRRLRWAAHVAHIEESRNLYRVSVGRPERKRLGKPIGRRDDNIEMDLKEVGCDARNLSGLAQVRDQCRAYVRVVMNHRVS